MVVDEMVSFEAAKLLKQVGFDVPCRRFYDTETDDPDMEWTINLWNHGAMQRNSNLLNTEYACCTQQMALRFLREEYHFHIEIRFTNIQIFDNKMVIPKYYGIIYNLDTGRWIWESTLVREYIIGFDTFEEAVDFMIKKCIEKFVLKKQ